MIKGLEKFKNHFSDYSDSYVLIGGVACSVAMEEVGLEFRATKDLDVVLYVETLDKGFVLAFWDFINRPLSKLQSRASACARAWVQTAHR